MNPIYFDNAASTPVDPEVVQTMTDALENLFANPSSLHSLGRRSKAAIENARIAIASACGCQPAEVIFTSGGTEANNLILRGGARAGGISHVITSKIEHKAVLDTVADLDIDEISYVKLDERGVIDLDDLARLLDKSAGKTTLVSLMHGNNEIGNVNDIRAIGRLVGARGALFHSDMVQTLGKCAIDLSDLPVHFASFSAHKIYGPKGAGFAYIKKGTPVAPQLTGGGQERDKRSGTENICAILGMAKAVALMVQRQRADFEQISDVKRYLIAQIEAHLPEVEFNGQSQGAQSLCNLVSIQLPGSYPMIHFQLDLNDIAVSAGSACSSGATKLASVAAVLGIENTAIRVSLNRYNTKAEVDVFVKKLRDLLRPE
ncbi:MAG: cysteine desulfurase family protein [Flavobacteriales bacterium]